MGTPACVRKRLKKQQCQLGIAAETIYVTRMFHAGSYTTDDDMRLGNIGSRHTRET